LAGLLHPPSHGVSSRGTARAALRRLPGTRHRRGTRRDPDSNWRRQLPALTHASVSLRGLRKSDATALLDHLNKPPVLEFIQPSPASVAEFERFIRWTQTRRRAGRHVCFGVLPSGHDRPVGIIQVWPIEQDFATAECGFVLSESYWGTGLFLQAARMTFDFAFGTLGVHRIEARSVQTNARGNAVLRKLGARRDGVLREAFHRDGRFQNYIMWSILAPEWAEIRKRLLTG
jgi:ribosomal-protein-alanine N-acetyltransferase